MQVFHPQSYSFPLLPMRQEWRKWSKEVRRNGGTEMSQIPDGRSMLCQRWPQVLSWSTSWMWTCCTLWLDSIRCEWIPPSRFPFLLRVHIPSSSFLNLCHRFYLSSPFFLFDCYCSSSGVQLSSTPFRKEELEKVTVWKKRSKMKWSRTTTTKVFLYFYSHHLLLL